MGKLRVYGKIDVNQFYPRGKSDADTIKLDIADSQAFEYIHNNNTISTDVFYKFYSQSHFGKKKLVHNLIKNKRTYIVIRLQGVDAPELHYKNYGASYNSNSPEKLRNSKEYLQIHGIDSAKILYDFLTSFNKDYLNAEFFTDNIQNPHDVFDCYGRFVGDVIIYEDGKQISLVKYIAENGLAIPTFYSSMTENEMNTITNYCNLARNSSLGVWAFYSNKLSAFDPTHILTKSKFNNYQGILNFPKIFRRLTEYYINTGNKKIDNSFLLFLKNKNDKFLLNGTHYTNLSECIINSILPDPEFMIFSEKGSSLVSLNGLEQTDW